MAINLDEEKVADLIVSGKVSLQSVYNILIRKNIVAVYDDIDKEIRMAKAKGLDADTVISILSCKYSPRVLQDVLKVYINVNSYVDEIITDKGLTFSTYYNYDYDYYMSNKDLVNHELKNRGIKDISIITNYVDNSVSIFAGDDWVDTWVWDEYYCSVRASFADEFDFAIDEALYDVNSIQDALDVDLEELEQYWDIYKALKNYDSIKKKTHEWDIFFADKAISGETVYLTDEIITEIYRLYEYFYSWYKDAFDRIETVIDSVSWAYSLADCDSFVELKCAIIDAQLEDWFCYNSSSEIDVKCISL